MPNKLKNVFSNDPIEHTIKLSFTDEKSGIDFQKAINSVSNDGKRVVVKGVDEVKPTIKMGNECYPMFETQSNIECLTIEPSKENIEFNLEKEGKTIKILGCRYTIKGGTIIEIQCGKILNAKLKHESETKKIVLSFKQNPEKATTIMEIQESYELAVLLLEYVFRKDMLKEDHPDAKKDFNKMEDFKATFSTMALLYKKLSSIEDKYELEFNPSDIVVDSDFCETIEEVYDLVINKKVIRYRGGIIDFNTDAMNLASEETNISIGQEILLAYSKKLSYKILNINLIVFSVIALLNARVKEIYTSDHGKIDKVIYEGSDSEPLFIAYSGFKTEQEAIDELKEINKKIDLYRNAKTVMHYVHENV